jgi:putative transposase
MGGTNMPHWRRYYIPNALVFITTVTKDRQNLFGRQENVSLLFDTMHRAQDIHPFHLLAYVVLPDHMHFLMRTDPSVTFSEVMQCIKGNFTYQYKLANAITSPLVLWQSRFWDHIIRDEQDLARHLDYIHYNPVKHCLAAAPDMWEHSTFSFWAKRGYYEQAWGSTLPRTITDMELE